MNCKYMHNQLVNFLEKMARQQQELNEMLEYASEVNSPTDEAIKASIKEWTDACKNVVEAFTSGLNDDDKRSVKKWSSAFDDLLTHKIPF
jgi:hypothetical protein